MVARLGKPGHRQAYPCSCVLGAIVRGRQRGHIREKFRAAKRLIIPGPGGRFQKVVMGRFSRRRSAATLLPANFSARRFRSARSLLLREKGARGSSSFCGLQISRARSADAPIGNRRLSQCSVNSRRVDSKADGTCTASNVDDAAVRRGFPVHKAGIDRCSKTNLFLYTFNSRRESPVKLGYRIT